MSRSMLLYNCQEERTKKGKVNKMMNTTKINENGYDERYVYDILFNGTTGKYMIVKDCKVIAYASTKAMAIKKIRHISKGQFQIVDLY